MKIRFVKNLWDMGYNGDARLYRLVEPIQYNFESKSERNFTQYVVILCPFDTRFPETFIFPSDSKGEVIEYIEMYGSFKGDMDHARAIKNAGWEL